MWHVVGSSHRAKFNRYGVGICWGWAVLGRWQEDSCPPVPSYLPPRLPPLVRIITLGALQGFSFFL